MQTAWRRLEPRSPPLTAHRSVPAFMGWGGLLKQRSGRLNTLQPSLVVQWWYTRRLKKHGNQPLSCHAMQDIPDDCPMYVDAKGALGLGQWGSTHISPTL